ncbi:hypothetical protein OS493_002074 [Desmophyllum pertusum]|uniref:Uncharacterized protein n=1 Tax=Desmophyllum pertusum TaxID=174260 RepID=A0A9W9Z7G6_9CNID|nr:hypothetical protein OS493_002074 [Desmophyllum pertusum]
MSSPCNSSSSSSGSEGEESLNEPIEFSGFVPYDEDLEPLATAEEAAEHEAKNGRRRRNRTGSGCFYMVRQVNCLTFMISNLLAFDRGLMGKFGDPHQCITLHPGFQDVCLNRHVLEIAALGLKTKAGKSYRTMFPSRTKNGSRVSEVSGIPAIHQTALGVYWQVNIVPITRLGSIFPDENGHYHGFEDDNQ